MSKPITARQLIDSLGELVIRKIGDETKEITHPAPLEKAVSLSLAFVKHDDARLIDAVRQSKAGTIICGDHPDLDAVAKTGSCLICTANPRLAFMRAVAAFFVATPDAGIHPTAIIHPASRIDPTASIGPYVVIDADCSVGARTMIHAHVRLYAKTRIGANVTIHSGTVIGADGFGYERNEHGALEKFPHIGGVAVEDDVDIGSNTSIDRGTLGDTLIRKGAKVDNQVHVAHNVVIGRHAAVIAQSMLGGSATFGDRAWVAPSACVMNQAKVGADATVGLGAVVVKDVPDGMTVMGVPARSAEDFRALQAALKKMAASSK